MNIWFCFDLMHTHNFHNFSMIISGENVQHMSHKVAQYGKNDILPQTTEILRAWLESSDELIISCLSSATVYNCSLSQWKIFLLANQPTRQMETDKHTGRQRAHPKRLSVRWKINWEKSSFSRTKTTQMNSQALSLRPQIYTHLLNAWVMSGSIKEWHLKAKRNVASGTNTQISKRLSNL